MSQQIEVYHSSGGARIYRLPMQLFPILQGFANLVFVNGIVALIDVGSGFGDSNEQLEAGLEAVRETHGEQVGWDQITHVLLTHGHIDHYGGLHYVRERTTAKVGIHEMDLRVLTHFEDRLAIIEKRLRRFLAESGVDADKSEGIMTLYLMNKHLFSSLEPDFTFEAEGMQVGPMRMTHVPGHCPGHVLIQLHDILFVGDHVLPDVSPHQAPERLTLNTGLGHYLESLRLTRTFGNSVRLAIGGHGPVIEDIAGRVHEIEQLHRSRLAEILELLDQPMTIAGVSDALFPDVEGYTQLLALEEAGAHVEYLSQRGYLGIENLDELGPSNAVPIVYRREKKIEEMLKDFDRQSSLADSK
jgi:glyoxylase-like metal-dependent hydrolase (beta-lactamase superfamily II)